MAKQIIKINESELHSLIQECVVNVLNERKKFKSNRKSKGKPRYTNGNPKKPPGNPTQPQGNPQQTQGVYQQYQENETNRPGIGQRFMHNLGTSLDVANSLAPEGSELFMNTARNITHNIGGTMDDYNRRKMYDKIMSMK